MNLPFARDASFATWFWRGLLCGLLLLAAPGCQQQPNAAKDELAQQRREGSRSSDPSEVTDWFFAEMLRPGGASNEAEQARARLDEIQAKGVLPSLARGIFDAGRGLSKEALGHFFEALQAARVWEDERASLFGWYAALRVSELLPSEQDFKKTHRDEIGDLLTDPGNIGFRAYGSLVDVWAADAFAEAEENVDERLAQKLGCVDNLSLVGPFGTDAAADILRSFEPERAFGWPAHFEREPGQARTPSRLKTEQSGCDVVVAEPTDGGIFYFQTFVDVEEPQDVIMTASGAHQLWVDDSSVLQRDIRIWGIWPRFGVQLHLDPGRHRIVWKTNQSSSALRITTPQGKAAEVSSVEGEVSDYHLAPPRVLADPNDLMRYIRPQGVADIPDEITRLVVAYLADEEGESDVAAVAFEPLIEDPEKATGIALSTAAIFVHGDPIYGENQTKELVHELELRAAEKDPGLWHPRYRNLVWTGRQKGATTILSSLEKLADDFPQVPRIRFALAELYEELAWGPEHERTVRYLIDHFPNDEDAIRMAIDHFESEGDQEQVDKLLARLTRLNPDSEIMVARALHQKRYAQVLRELKRLQARRPSRKDIAGRIERVLLASGEKQDTLALLEKAILQEPRDAHARLAVADHQLAAKKKNPLAEALVQAVEASADPSPIAGAIDLVEGITALEPYRIDGQKVINDYEARGKHLSGTAVRILDYGAVWIHRDGSSRFLEHEIVRIQSEEAIKKFSETSAGGLILRLRVIKRDGTILEPEAVAGKPTATMPHLELGDYVETERIVSRWGAGLDQPYSGPGWFFKEQGIAYARSEFVVIAPAEKKLILETHNQVPQPQVTTTGSLVVYRYRVDESPAAPMEPMSPPVSEFLPRVSVGWDLSLAQRLRQASRAVIPVLANDPRIVRIAKKIVADETTERDRARAVYHWVLDHVQDGDEADGRRVVVSQNGNRWRAFETLCRALAIPVTWALAESKLASPIAGPISSTERPLSPLLIVGEPGQRTWLTIDDKFAPFGTVPSHLRGERAYLLGDWEALSTTVSEEGVPDGIRYEGTGSLDENGTAELDLRIIFEGSYAASLRNGLSQIPGNQLGKVIESNFLGQNLQGALLKGHEVIDQDQLDKPLIIRVQTEVPQFATPSKMGLLLSPPFMPRLSQMTTLASRATPLLINQQSVQSLALSLKLPPSVAARVKTHGETSPHSEFEVKDSFSGSTLTLSRKVVTRAGRIGTDKYSAFQSYAQRADVALHAAIRLSPTK